MSDATVQIKTVGDLRRGLGLRTPDDQPVEFFLNGVATTAAFLLPGENGGDISIDVQPNYTCKSGGGAP